MFATRAIDISLEYLADKGYIKLIDNLDKLDSISLVLWLKPGYQPLWMS